MKKITLFILMSLMGLLFAGCNNKENNKEVSIPNINVEEIIVDTVIDTPVEQEPVGDDLYNEEYEMKSNSIWLVSRRVDYDAEDPIRPTHEYKYEYDDAGNKTKDIGYNADGAIYYWFEYEYDSKGNLVKEISFNDDASIKSQGEYSLEYDGHGNILKSEYYNPGGNINSWVEYEYSVAGNVFKETHYKSDDSISYWVEYEYDDNLLAADKSFTLSGGCYEENYYINGIKTQHIRYNADGKISKCEKYDTYGFVIEKISYVTHSKIIRTEYLYTYGTGDKPISCVVTEIIQQEDEYNSQKTYHAYEYDINGNLIKDSIARSEASVIDGWTEYEWIEIQQ